MLTNHWKLGQYIIKNAPEVIDDINNGKLFINENRIRNYRNGYALELENEKIVPLPFLLKGFNGLFLIIDPNKPFKLVCLNPNCKYEWTGGVFTVRCPMCGGKEFEIRSNW